MVKALEAGVRFFQYRNKTGTRNTIYQTALSLTSKARDAGALLILNDHADIARATHADGVHLGQDDFPLEQARAMLGTRMLIGVSTHSLEQAKSAQAAGADYIGFGPIFPTSTKDAGKTQGLQALTTLTHSITVPVIAIGGINHANVRDAVRTGADGIAVISAILSAEDIPAAAGEMLKLISDVRRVE